MHFLLLSEIEEVCSYSSRGGVFLCWGRFCSKIVNLIMNGRGFVRARVWRCLGWDKRGRFVVLCFGGGFWVLVMDKCLRRGRCRIRG